MTVVGKLTILREDGPFLTKIIRAIRVAKVAELRECTSVGNGGRRLGARRDLDALGRELVCDPVGEYELAREPYNAAAGRGQRQHFSLNKRVMMIRTGVAIKEGELDHVLRADPG